MSDDPHPLFAAFSAAPSVPIANRATQNPIVRPARHEDIDALARIAAEREGGAMETHAASFESSIAKGESDCTSLVLTAKIEPNVVGFGKARYLGARDLPAGDRAPEGWYLTGVVVDPAFRRLGAGSVLTDERLRWIAARADTAYYFANARNRATLALHERFGFVEIARGPAFAGVTFTGGEGILFRIDLAATPHSVARSAADR